MIINDDKFKKLYSELCSAMKSLGYEQAKLESFKNYDFAINYNINTSTSNNKNIDDKEYDALKESAERECEKKSYLKANRWKEAEIEEKIQGVYIFIEKKHYIFV